MSVRAFAANQLLSTPLSSRLKTQSPLQKNGLKQSLQQAGFRNQELAIKSKLINDAKITRDTAQTAKRITRRHYPTIVELKTAGRSDPQIAKRFGVDEIDMKIHISRAMRQFRDGDVDPNEGNSVTEAKKVGEEKGAKFQQRLAKGYQSPGSNAAPRGVYAPIPAPPPSVTVA